MSKETKLETKYRKMSQYEHIIKRPDTYIGSVKTEVDKQYLLCDENDKKSIKEKEINNIQGLYKIFDEIIVNAIDNKNRIDNKIENGDKKIKPMTTLEVNIFKYKPDNLDEPKWAIEVKNDGEGIDIEKHPTEKIWIPDMIFGQLLTSSNYDDTEKKITGGKNGYGAKLTNIYSHYFCVETVDHKRKRHYKKEYFNRMKNSNEPNIKEKYNKKPYTSITFIPYYEAFGLTDLSDELISLFKKRVYDMIYCGFGNIKVILNNEELLSNIKLKLTEYIKYYNINEDIEIYECSPHKRWLISACLSSNFQFNQISFVNGIYTSRGGKHVDYVSRKIYKALSNYIKKKKKIDINEKFIKDNLMVFINCIIENPDFDGQTKETLKTPASRFGSNFELPENFINQIATKSGIIERALAQNQFQDNQLLKKTDGKKTRYLNIPKLNDADYAGTVKSSQCTLILTEGDSAKATAIAGISVVKNGGSIFGVFPLKGKLLNTRDRNSKDIANNVEISNIKKIIGLQEKRDYSNVKNIATLRYGRVMIMTDQDVDGSHIKGLLINYFEHNFPSLIKNNGFIVSLATPIVKIWKDKGGKKHNLLNFYDLPSFKIWLSNNNDGKGWKTKYYKGLGTSTKLEAKEYFQNPKIVEFSWDDESAENIDKAFNNKRANDRKQWLQNFRNEVLKLDDTKVSYTEFIDKELIHFSMYDNNRSISNLMDGLKPGQRKILYSCFKRKLHKEIKVAQLGGYVSEHSAYHHGEVSLYGTIINMAQDYPGSNNINILMNIGQFGTRLEGGKDSAQPRYIFTCLQDITNIIYNKNDMPLYNYILDDGQMVEPICYAPIIPMALINGCEGIGTGWSCKIPQFNPNDIVYNIRQKINGGKLRELTPWYRGYKGSITKIKKNSWLSKGCYRIIDEKTVEITELPVGMWTTPYKDLLNNMVNNTKNNSKSKNNKTYKNNDKYLKDFTIEPSDTTIYIKLIMENNILDELLSTRDKEGINKFEKEFKLTTKISCDKTLNFFDNDNKLIHFTDINDIFDTYYDYRLKLYDDRKIYLLGEMKRIYKITNYKMKFIMGFINDTIKLKNISQENVYKQLEDMDFPHIYNNNLISKKHEKYNEGDYSYLLNLRISTLTKEKVDELKNDNEKIETDIYNLEKKSPGDLWIDDLNDFDKSYKEHMKQYFKANELDPKDYTKKSINKKLSINIK